MITRRAFLAAGLAAFLPRAARRTMARPYATLTDSPAGWATDQWTGHQVLFLGDTPRTQTVASNSETTIMVAEPFRVTTLSGWTTQPTVAALDLTGSEQLHKADARCIRAGRVRERFGLLPRERAQLRRMGCRKVNGEWHTSKQVQA